MDVVWDPAKARSNLIKHGVDFAEAAVALEDENALTVLDDEHGGFRFPTLARGAKPDVLFIVHSEQDEETLRIISARKATKGEERHYFSGDFHE